MVNGKDAGGLFGLPYEITLALLLILLVVLLGVAFILIKVRRQVKELQGKPSHDDTGVHERAGWFSRMVLNYNARANKTMVVMSILGILSLLMVYGFYVRAQDLGTQIGYSPEQPIKFNHKIHAGQLKIQCEYCHNGVRKNKNAGIPSLNICMNCHNYVKEGPQYGTTEIAKLYQAVDFHPDSVGAKQYGNHPHPVKWVRIHNLPDLSYFNHAQHVNVGKLECVNCHGNVANMERVQQVSTLEMGWCINCHRERKVNKDNPYYASTFDFMKKHKSYTIAQLGGLECSKCHY